MNGRLLEIAVRPIRIAFLLGKDPSKKLVNTVISINTGLWGGIYNFICPTGGNFVSDEYGGLLSNHYTDCIVFCGTFDDRQGMIANLSEHNIQPTFLQKKISLQSMEMFGVGVEGVFDSRFLQSIQRNIFQDTAIVNPRIGNTTYLDKVRFGIPPDRIKKYVEERADFISVKRYNKISEKQSAEYDQIISTIEMTSENLKTYRLRGGRRLALSTFRYGRLYCVVGDTENLDDVCYFWNLRAIFGSDRVIWIDKGELDSFIGKREAAYSRGVTLTSISTALQENIRKFRKESGGRYLNYSQPRALFRMRAYSSFQSEPRTLHTPIEGEFIVTTARPSLFGLRFPRNPRWVMDIRIIKDDVIGTEGFMLPEFSYLSGMLTPTQSSRLRPRITGEIFSLQVTSTRTDEHFRFRIPKDWEVIQSIFKHHGI